LELQVANIQNYKLTPDGQAIRLSRPFPGKTRRNAHSEQIIGKTIFTPTNRFTVDIEDFASSGSHETTSYLQ
jgi:hypothetical protein